MLHVIRQTLRSAYLSMMGTFAKPAVGIHIISGHRIEDELRRCGAHTVVLPDGTILQQAVVEIAEGRVVNYYEFRFLLLVTKDKVQILYFYFTHIIYWFRL